MWSYGLSFAAGAITSLSPCVLPVLPVVVGSAGQRSRHGPLALAAGLVVSFTAAGIVVASAGMALGVDGAHVRRAAAVLLVAVGLALLSTRLQHFFEGLAAPLAGSASRTLGKQAFAGFRGQFFVGALLGAVWSPCSGPTLGAAIGMAAQSETLLQAAAIMLLFGLGAALPLLAIGYGAQTLLTRKRAALLRFGAIVRNGLGYVLVLAGALVLTGLDRQLEAVIVNHLPAGWTDLITRF